MASSLDTKSERSREPALGDAVRAHLPTLDGLRGIAVALVMVTHLPAEPAAQIHRAVPQLMHMGGYLGVDLFFVLSGFLITRILLADSSTGSPLKFFLIRRCLRIFPIYYLTLLLNALLAPSMTVLWCATYLSNYYFAFVSNESLLRHTWSLCIEEHFYMFWPLLVRRVSRAASFLVLRVLMFFSLASSAALVLAHVPHAASLIYEGTLSRIWSLALGALVAYSRFAAGGRPNAWQRALPMVVGLAFALGAAALGAVGRTPAAYLAMVPGYSLISLSALLTALAAGRGGAGAVRWLSARPLRFTGRISYGLYLYHPFVYRVFMAAHGERLGLSLALRAALAVGAAFAVAALSYRYFESYFLCLKSRFVMPRTASATN